MKIQTIKIPDDVADVLQRSTIDGTLLHLPGEQLERKLYASTAKVLKALGIIWNKGKAAHVLPANDVGDELRAALSTGKVVDRKKTLQLFETPVELAERVVAGLAVTSEDRCLEPSAGLGRIAMALFKSGAEDITAVEIDGKNVEALDRLAIARQLHTGDFLALDPDDFGRFDVIAMNPPFTGNQDIRHVRHAARMLAPGGRLAAIVSGHGFTGQEAEAAEWRAWLRVRDAKVEVIPAGTFKESGTSIETHLITLRNSAA